AVARSRRKEACKERKESMASSDERSMDGLSWMGSQVLRLSTTSNVVGLQSVADDGDWVNLADAGQAILRAGRQICTVLVPSSPYRSSILLNSNFAFPDRRHAMRSQPDSRRC